MEVIVHWTDPTKGVESFRSGYAEDDERLSCRMGPLKPNGLWCVAVTDRATIGPRACLAVCDDPSVTDLEGYLLWLASHCVAVEVNGRMLYEAPDKA